MNFGLFVALSIIVQCNGDGYSTADSIQIGPRYDVVGFYPSLTVADYPTANEVWIISPGTYAHGIIWQSVINTNYFGGGLVYIKEGVYEVEENLNFDGITNIHINGDGKGKTVLKLIDSAPPFIFVNNNKKAGFIRTRYAKNIIISNLTLDGNKFNQLNDADHTYGRFGIFCEGCDNIFFDNVEIVNFQGYGFHIHGDKKNGLWSNRTTIKNCNADNNNIDGFIFDQTQFTTVLSSSASNNGRHGFNTILGSQYAYFLENFAINNGFYNPSSGCGFMINGKTPYETKNIIIDKMYAHHNKKAGICLTNVSNISITHTVVDDCCICYYFTNGSDAVFNNNKCYSKIFYRNINNVVVKESEGVQLPYSVFIKYNNSFDQHTTCSTPQYFSLIGEANIDETEYDDGYYTEQSFTSNGNNIVPTSIAIIAIIVPILF